MTDNITIADANHKECLAQTTGVVLFHKKLCPNCKALEKMLDKFFAANTEIKYLRIDSEECPETMKEYAVERVPTLLVMKQGRVVAQKVGLMNLREMTDFYQSA